MDNEKMFRLQNVIYPSKDLTVDWDMYFRVAGGYTNSLVNVLVSDNKILFRQGGFVSFDTFFNGFTVQAWRNNTNIDKLFLKFNCKGQFLLRISQHLANHQLQHIHEFIIDADNPEQLEEIESWRNLKDGILYFSLKALKDNSEYYSAEFVTNSDPVNQVKLGVVVTHFNRKNYVVPALRRISEELLADENYSGINLIVADNSCNISDEEKYKAIVIPNRNLGGSGGFMRGLLYLEDNNFSHCLFMDDDASCEIESIRRTYHLLQFATKQKFSIAGSLLRESETFRLYEKGAKFDNSCIPLKPWLDMRNVNDLVFAEDDSDRSDYGAWWFFAFRIADIKYHAFPFFVRGDDVLFGRSNQFFIQTLNGVGCWGEDFGYKDGPLPKYLDVRNHILQNMWSNYKNYTDAYKMIRFFFLSHLLSFQYASAKSVLIAVQHSMLGKPFWLENLDMANIRAEIAKFATLEKMNPIILTDYSPDVLPQFQERRLRKFVRLVTINGLLLPKFLRKDNVLFQEKGFEGNLRHLFRYRKVLYFHSGSKTGYYTEFNATKFFTLLIEYFRTIKKLNNSYDVLKAHYKTEMPKMMTKEFWQQVYTSK